MTAGPRRRALRLAHRGDHRSAAENSIAALRAAIALRGVDGVEFDLRASADGEAVLLHDATLERVQGRPEPAAALSAAELGQLGVPTLAMALAVLPGDAFLDIELKEDVVVATVEAVRRSRGGDPTRMVLSSFDPAILERVRATEPGWPVWLNTSRLDRTAVRTGLGVRCRGMSAEWRSVDTASVAIATEAGLEVAAWTVTDPNETARLDALGIFAICIEGPALADPSGNRSHEDRS
jgi:glycerophosphoryl diester phosphodiesterase